MFFNIYSYLCEHNKLTTHEENTCSLHAHGLGSFRHAGPDKVVDRRQRQRHIYQPAVLRRVQRPRRHPRGRPTKRKPRHSFGRTISAMTSCPCRCAHTDTSARVPQRAAPTPWTSPVPILPAATVPYCTGRK